MNRSFWQSGHRPTLIASFLYFDMAFMVWVILGPLAPLVSEDLGLSPAQKGFMVAVPNLAGALLRIVMGLLGDRIGQKRAGALGQVVVIGGLLAAYLIGIGSFASVLLLGVVLGFAGASFAVALPLASRWYPPEHQGKALGVAGMGNSGTVLASLFAPTLAAALGWTSVLGLACIPLAIVFVAYMVMAKDSPDQPPPMTWSVYLQPLKDRDAWWFMLFYGVTFGGFVGLTASLSIYFVDQFGLTAVEAGYATAGCVFAGSLIRPLGGAMADRFGGIRTLSFVYMLAAVTLVAISTGPSSLAVALALFVVAMLSFGTGNGAVFQLVPQRFRREIGVMTGLVGCAGGIGGFFLSSSLGLAEQYTGSPQAGFLVFAVIALIALGGLTVVKVRWRTTWGAAVQGVRI
ncbi:nitrate/nitrite transporter [Altericroceibacterium xinjiangense]|uniref:nitrate/nitrite transporter n=1 Tax=Altericroceibacterium xinjiangense TaxID=762261 RepID=UPI000F7EDE22|nr:nitrate/nitrite transporter [Altericroceibacterium xinjiangense]